jgi:mRNA interferase MazF
MTAKKAPTRYCPKQGDIVWVDFDPTRGREIKKRRPACVVSSDNYNRLTGFVVVCPITSNVRNNPANYTLSGTKTSGQIITSQIRSLDVSQLSGRKIEFIEKLTASQLGSIAQMISFIFEFDPLFTLI